MLVVPDKQMHDFIMLMDLAPDSVSFNDEDLLIGSKIRVVKGQLSGLEGEIASDSHRTFVVVRIHGLFSASVKLPKSYLKLIK